MFDAIILAHFKIIFDEQTWKVGEIWSTLKETSAFSKLLIILLHMQEITPTEAQTI